MKKVSKAIQNKINAINEMIPAIETLDEIPIAYDGGTFPFYVEVYEITLKNQFVYINAPKSTHNASFEKRYNVNNENQLDILEHDLALILKTFKKYLKK